MATFPVLESAGTAYLVQLWGSSGVSLLVGCPVASDLPSAAFEDLLRQFGENVANLLNSNLVSVTRYETTDEIVYQPPA
jgi:hypothetical protein